MHNNFDTVFVNGKIFTSDDNFPEATAMAVKDGRIAWIGKTGELDLDKETVVDLQGKRVLPGFIDIHFHARYMADTLSQIPCLPPNIYSIEELKEKVREKAKEVGKGVPIIGWGYDEGKFKEQRAPLRADLDEAAPDNPVIIIRICCHAAALNTMALKAIGVDKNTPVPAGGQICRDENGELNGIITERAKFMIDDYLTANSTEKMSAKLKVLGDFLLSHGITAIAESLATLVPTDCYEVYRDTHEMGMKQRVVMYYPWDEISKLDWEIPEELKDTGKPIYIGGVKLLGDGAVSAHTAWCSEPYIGTDDHGVEIATPEELTAAVEYAKRHNVQIKFHAMGDLTVDRVVKFFDGKADWLKDGRPSVRIEHFAMPSEEDIDICARSGIAASMQPSFLYAEIESYLNNIGIERTRKTYPTKTALEKGMLLGFASDSPAATWADPSDPFMAMKGAVTRVSYDGTQNGADQAVDVATAIKLYTCNNQKIMGIKDVGILKEGYHADFMILDRDILEIPKEEIDQVNVDNLYMEGKEVFTRRP